MTFGDNSRIFVSFLHKTCCGYSLEVPPHNICFMEKVRKFSQKHYQILLINNFSENTCISKKSKGLVGLHKDQTAQDNVLFL